MSKTHRRSAVRMMIVAGGLVAAVPALGESGAITCNGKAQTPASNGGNAKSFFCNMAPKTNGATAATPPKAARGMNAGFYCNMAPKKKKDAKSQTASHDAKTVTPGPSPNPQ